MNRHSPLHTNPLPCFSRREFLSRAGTGFGILGLAGLFAEQGLFAADPSLSTIVNPLAARAPQFPARAKHVIHLLANGGPSQMDTFDPKPALAKYAGQRLPFHLETERPTGVALPSPFSFRPYGQSGIEVSELFGKLAEKHIDDLCIIRSMHTETPIHENSLRMMNCGDSRMARPSVGAWLTYGLGTENQNLPGFVVLIPQGMPVAGADNWQSAFLPGPYQGCYVETWNKQLNQLIENLQNSDLSGEEQRSQLDLLQKLNQKHLAESNNHPALEARIHNFETAFRMQISATDAFDIEKEPQDVRDMYGDKAQAKQMLMARRLVERGVRYVQVWHGGMQPWDSHENIESEHRRLADECCQGITALLTDLKQSGLLDETLVIWGGEFGRTPAVELPQVGTVKTPTGRDHNPYGFTVWLAGGGVKGGMVHGATDEFGFRAVEDRVQVHDLHATILHLMGLDHEKLTFRHSGRDYRLTDVHGQVVRAVLA